MDSVKDFGLSSVDMDRHLSWAGPRKRLFFSSVPELVTCQGSCALSEENQGNEVTTYFGIQLLWPNKNRKNAWNH